MDIQDHLDRRVFLQETRDPVEGVGIRRTAVQLSVPVIVDALIMVHVVPLFPEKLRQALSEVDHVRLRIFRVVGVGLLGVGMVDQDLGDVGVFFDGKVRGEEILRPHQVPARRCCGVDVVEFFHQVVVIVEFF